MNRIQKQMSLWLFILTMVFPMFLMGQSDKNLVRQGNKNYQDAAYNEAEINYRKALDKNPTNTVAQFNLGGAMYSQENYEKAAEVYAATDIKEKSAEEKSAVYYNLGNSMLKAGKSNEAIAAYKQSLRENPKNEEARYNLEYLRQKQQQNKDQNKDDKKDQDKEDKKNQDKDQEKQDKNKDKQEQNKDQQDQNQDQQQDQPQDQKNQQGEQNEQQTQKISKKDAERMLDALKNNEKKTLEKLKKAKKKNAKVIKSEKDW